MIRHAEIGSHWSNSAPLTQSRAAPYSDGVPESSTRVIRREGRPATIEFTRCALTVAEGPDAGKEAPLETSLFRIGTSPGSALVLTDPTVSRTHCEIEIGEGGFLLRDLGSTNGVFVAGLQVREIFLEPGATFLVGATKIELKRTGDRDDDRSEIRLSDREKFGSAVGRSIKMREVFFLLERVSQKDVTILLTGETGTGKEVIARSIHEEGPRRGAPFVTVDCGSLPENLIESELFGHSKGAFTGATGERAGAFEEANRGTVFLDEIGELPLAQQAKLLRVLENREVKRLGENNARTVDVRIIAATNRSLAEEVEEGRFRKDLFFRLSVAEVRIPALRERPDDIPLLAEHFLQALAARSKSAKPRVTVDALNALRGYPWPGNVRELRNVLEKALALAEKDEIDASAIAVGSIRNRPDLSKAQGAFVIDPASSFDVAHDHFEREYLMALLKHNEMNISKAARVAGIHRQTIHRMLRKHGIDLDEFR